MITNGYPATASEVEAKAQGQLLCRWRPRNGTSGLVRADITYILRFNQCGCREGIEKWKLYAHILDYLSLLFDEQSSPTSSRISEPMTGV